MLKPVADFVAEAKTQCTCLDARAARELFDSKDEILILDVREPNEAEANKLAGSINIPRGVLEMKIPSVCPDPDHPILVHCAAGGRAALAGARLQEMGYKNVHVIECSFDDIKAAFD